MGKHTKAALVRLGVLLAAVFTVLGVGTAAAQAAPRVDTAAGDVTVTAACNYVVIATKTYIRSGPGTQYSIVRTKYKGDRMTGPAPCVPTSNGWWLVYLSTGGIAYASTADVRYTG
ncbi:hypothetical protein AB0A74_18325 [Saccharothrix sp. NPDC042600]|uniref:SH3 domain-containing protein n=1 Tax=Saccharothrix TaxID=2071 RepID=UPI0033F7470B|nr:hypothetical protein GCM10017745_51560 [Saccharothrix mutabilis subsp. capreolus]